MRDETLLRYLRERTKVENIDIDTMRSVYISHLYNNYNLNWKEKETMASKMRHDPRTAQHKYLKVLEKTKTETAKDERIRELEEQVKKLTEKLKNMENEKDKINDKVNNLKDEKQGDPVWRKRRYDVVFRLNKGIQKNIKESTLEKIDIKYNKDTGKYY